MQRVFLIVLLVLSVEADLRIHSTPARGLCGLCPYYNNAKEPSINNLSSTATVWERMGPGSGSYSYLCNNIWFGYYEPSTFNYTGLGKFRGGVRTVVDRGQRVVEKTTGGQKNSNYDNFLRSNIDNEQDNRQFGTEDGKDHLPFRTWDAFESYTSHWSQHGGGLIKTVLETEAGDSTLIPFRWNNPHAAELEVNIWIFDHAGGKDTPVVVPVRKPTCSGEGYQDNMILFKIPEDFVELGSKIPGFKGCTAESKPMCTVQVYAHSVESRTYALGFPIIIHGHKVNASAASGADIQPATKDNWFDLGGLRELCRPSNDPDAHIKNAEPRRARLVSDVYNHAYQNSDFSPYSGQQQESISRNLQASAINKMVTGNRGELGKSLLTREMTTRINQLQTLEDTIYKNYEALANKIIKTIGHQMKSQVDMRTTMGWKNGKRICKQTTAITDNCFRCAETGSMRGQRLETNTYIPSFQLPAILVKQARSLLPPKYSELISPTGQVRIYVQSLMDLMPFFAVSHPYGIIYQAAMIKSTVSTMPDATNFRKLNSQDAGDRGQYAAMQAKTSLAASFGCPFHCLYCTKTDHAEWAIRRPLISGSQATCIAGDCLPCRELFNGFRNADEDFFPQLTTLAKDIVSAGYPVAEPGVKVFPDPDGSPRIGRPRQAGDQVTPPPLAMKKDWSFSTTPAPSTPKPLPTREPLICKWTKHHGKRSHGYANGVMDQFLSVQEAQIKCMQMYSFGQCQAITCSKPKPIRKGGKPYPHCTVNPSTALEPSDSGEFAFTYTCNRPIPPLQLSCVHDTGNAINYGRDPATGAERKKIIKGPHNSGIHTLKDPDFCRKMVGTNVGLNGGKVMFAVLQKRGCRAWYCWADCATYLDYFPSATAKLQYGQGEGLIAAYRAWIEHEGCDPEGGTTVTTTHATTTTTTVPATTTMAATTTHATTTMAATTTTTTTVPTAATTHATTTMAATTTTTTTVPTAATTHATTTMAATVPARRRRRRGSARRRRGRKQGDVRPSRRRRSSRRRRRRRAVSLAELEPLFKEVRMRVRSMAL